MGDVSNHNLLLFVPSVYDDHGWTPDEFRILARIHRRCVGKGGDVGSFYESIPNLAKATCMSQSVVRRSLNTLEAAGAISRFTRPGASTLIRFKTADSWRPADELPAIRKGSTPAKSDRGQVVSETTGGGVKSDKGPVPEPTGGVVSETIDEGYPLQGHPSYGVPSMENLFSKTTEELHRIAEETFKFK